MCPPVSARHGDQGMSYLHASWRYQLQHGDQLGICFACFKAAFLELRDLLELDDWEDEDWDPELTDPAEGGPEQGWGAGAGLSWGQGQGHPAQEGSADWGSGPPGSEEEGPDPPSMPTELEPQDAAPLGLGPEDADWTQSLPWRLGGPPSCSHWPSLPPPCPGFLKVDLPPGEPMVLELGSTLAVDPAEAEAWLRDLEVVSMVGCYDAIYLRKMVPGWVLRMAGQCWEVLLEPDELWEVGLQDAPQKQDLHRWELSVLEPAPAGQDEELVPADAALLRRGFAILSYAPWAQRGAGEGASAAGPRSSPSQGWDAGTAEAETEAEAEAETETEAEAETTEAETTEAEAKTTETEAEVETETEVEAETTETETEAETTETTETEAETETETGSSGPSGESLAATGAELGCFRPSGPGPQD